MSNGEEDKKVELSNELVQGLAFQMVQHAKIWGADEDLMNTMEDLQSELEVAGRGDVLEGVAERLGEVLSNMVSADIMDAKYAIVERHFFFPSGDREKAGSLPAFSVFGPVEATSTVIDQSEEPVAVEGIAMEKVSVRSLVEINHDAYEIMVDTGLMANPDSPFEIVMHSESWQNDIKSTTEFRLV